MIARELTEFFAGFSPDGDPVLQRAGDPIFLSNVNACYARACWAEIRFPDVAYAEDQAFGRAHARGRLAQGLSARARPFFMPTTTRPVEFMQRYFDEYRGLRETIGHVGSRLQPLAAAREVRADAAMDARPGLAARAGACAGRARSAVHHGRPEGRLRSRLASRAPAGPGCSARSRSRAAELRSAAGPGASEDPSYRVAATWPRCTARSPYADILRLSREGPAPLAEPVPGWPTARSTSRRSSRRSRAEAAATARSSRCCRGSRRWATPAPSGCTTPPDGRPRRPPCCGAGWSRSSPPCEAPVFKGFDDWNGADVVLATGWDTAYATMLLPDCRARAYLVQDHEPEFYATSAESIWAAQTYELGLYAIAASRWLRDLLRGAMGSAAPGSGSASTTASTARGRSSGAATPSSSTRASTRHAARCRSRSWRSRSFSAGGPTPGSWCSAKRRTSSCRSTTSCSASRRPRCSPGATRRRPSVSACRPPTTR